MGSSRLDRAVIALGVGLRSYLVIGATHLACVLSLLLIGATALAHTADDGLIAAREGRYEDALAIWRASGDAAAFHNIAGLYLTGVLGRPDVRTARTYFERAAEQDFAPAMLSLGHLEQNGLGAPADLVAAEMWFARGAALGSTEAKVAWARAVMGRNAESAELHKALEYLKAAAEDGDPQALTSIGDLLRTGTFVEKDVRRAILYYEQAAARGAPRSLNAVGDIHLFAELGAPDIPAAVKAYRAAAAAGSTDAMYSLAYLFDNDPAADAQLKTDAYQFAKAAALAWHEYAQLLLGRMYLNGEGVAVDPQQAYFWLVLATSAGIAEAHHVKALAYAQIGAEQAKLVQDRAARWYDENHGVPHTHRLPDVAAHSFR